jgi:hypothetical protein
MIGGKADPVPVHTEEAVARLRTAAGKPEYEDVISELNKICHGPDRVQ